GGARPRRVDAVDAEPAVLVEGDPHRVGVPAGDRGDARRVARAVEHRVSLDAHVLGAGSRDPEQPDRRAGGVDEVVALDADADRTGGGARRARQLGGDDGAGDEPREERSGRPEATPKNGTHPHPSLPTPSSCPADRSVITGRTVTGATDDRTEMPIAAPRLRSWSRTGDAAAGRARAGWRASWRPCPWPWRSASSAASW